MSCGCGVTSSCGGVSAGGLVVGVPGPRGPVGPAGPAGPAGSGNGDKGDKGDPGVPGRDGVDGRDGTDGAPGRDGVDGQDGAPGEKGDPGPSSWAAIPDRPENVPGGFPVLDAAGLVPGEHVRVVSTTIEDSSAVGRAVVVAADEKAGREALGTPSVYRASRVVTGAGIDLTGATPSDAAFQAILNAAAADAAAGGGVVEVYVPPGVLSLTSRIRVGAGVTLRGAGIGATTLRSSNEFGVLQLTGASDITVCDLDLQATAAGTKSIVVDGEFSTGVQKRVTVTRCRIVGSTNAAVRFPFAVENLTFSDNIVEDCDFGVTVYAPTVDSGFNSSQIVLSGNRFRRVGSVNLGIMGGVNFIPGSNPPERIYMDDDGKTISNVFDVEVSGNQLREFAQTGPAGPIPIEVTSVTNLRVAHNTIDGPSTRGISTGFNVNASIVGNTIRDQERYAIELNGGQQISIVGNVTEGCETFATESNTLDVSARLSDLLIANNVYFGSGRTQSKTSDAIALRFARRVRITGNLFTDWQFLRSAIRIGDGKSPVAEDVVVEGNTFVISDPETPLMAVDVRSALRTQVARNVFRVNRDLVAGDQGDAVITATMTALTEDTLIEGNHIAFTGDVAAAAFASGIGNKNASPDPCVGLTVRGNQVIGGPRGVRLLTNSPDLVAHTNETASCVNPNVIPAGALGLPAVELGSASDTTLTRLSAGDLGVAGVPVVTTTGVQQIANKTVSTSTLVNPVVQGSIDLNGDVRLVASTTVASGFYRLRLENKNSVPFAVFQNSASENFKTRLQVNVDEAANVVRFQALSNATPADNSANTGIDLFPMGSGVVTARNVPVVTTTAAQTLANKTLTFPTLTSPLLNDPTLNNPAINAKIVEFKDAGKTLFAVQGWSTGDPEGYVEVRTARNDFPFVQIGGVSGSLADVGIALAPQGKGAVTVNVGADASPTGSARTFPVGVKTTVPPNSATAGAPGMWAEDGNHLYIYTGDGTAHAWRRAALETW